MYIFFLGVLFVHVCHYAWIILRTLSIHVQIVMLSLGFTNHKPKILLIAKLTKHANKLASLSNILFLIILLHFITFIIVIISLNLCSEYSY